MKKSCKKKKRKNSLKKIFKGFTLVELLAVIVILAIIMIIAIPAVLNTMESARRKSFAEYVDKVSSLSQKQLAEDQMMGTKSLSGCHIYNIKTQLGLNNTGNYEGWVLINPSKNDIYVTLYDDNYVIIGYHYSDSSLKIVDYIQKKTNDNISKLTVDELCRVSSCSNCSVEASPTEESVSYVVSITTMEIGSSIPDGVKLRSTPEEAIADWKDILGKQIPRPCYLKHKIVNNKIEESYVGFIIPSDWEDGSGFKAGTYTLRGGIDESASTEKTIYETNKAILNSALGASNCTEDSLGFSCYTDGIVADLYKNGTVIVGDNSFNCRVDNDKTSYCS